MSHANDSKDRAAQPEELVHALLSATGEGIYGVDLDGNCTFANPACLGLLGYERAEELLGRNMHGLIHHTRSDGEPYPVEDCRIYQAFREQQGVHVADEIVWRADGTSFPAEYWSHPIFMAGELAGSVVAFLDVTERRQAEHDLRESEETVRALLNATGQGIYGVDLEGDCTFINPSGVRMLGCESEQELLGKTMHELIHHTRPSGEPYPLEECRIYQAFREGRGVHVGDEIVWRLDGTSFPAEYWSHPLHLHGQLAGCVVAFVDITERRQAEEELRQTEKLSALGKMSAGLAHELNNPAAAAQRAGAQIRELLVALDALVARLNAHGLSEAQWASLGDLKASSAAIGEREKLNAIERADAEDELISWLTDRGVEEPWDVAAGLAGAGLGGDGLAGVMDQLPKAAVPDALRWLCQSLAVAELVETIMISTRNISDLVAAVKEYSYMDRAPVQEVDVHDGIESTLRILGHRLKEGTRLVRDFDRGLPRVLVPAGELNQVWTNLIDNAIDAAGANGEVRVRTFREGDRLVVEVGDDGEGIPEGIRSRIFDPFFTTKDVGEGTGLGLDVARRIVNERCGGEIDFRSEPRETVFQVRLPIQALSEEKDGD